MNWFAKLDKNQRLLLMVGVPVVAAAALVATLKKKNAPAAAPAAAAPVVTQQPGTFSDGGSSAFDLYRQLTAYLEDTHVNGTPTTTTPTTTPAPPPVIAGQAKPTTNAAWLAMGVTWLVSMGYSAAGSHTALSKYLSGQPVARDGSEAQAVTAWWVKAGPPPQGAPLLTYTA